MDGSAYVSANTRDWVEWDTFTSLVYRLWQGWLWGSGDIIHVGVDKRVVGGAFDTKGKGGMGAGMSEADLKEDIEVAARKLGPSLMLVSYRYSVLH